MGKKEAVKSKINTWASKLKNNIAMLYLAYRDGRTPWYAKAIAIITVGYALSPVDLIPDFIPILGYLDDAIVLPGLIYICLKLIPKEVKDECGEKAKETFINGRPKSYIAGTLIIIIWICIIYFIIMKLL